MSFSFDFYERFWKKKTEQEIVHGIHLTETSSLKKSNKQA